MQKFKSHKVVEAGKLIAVFPSTESMDGWVRVEDDPNTQIVMPPEWFDRYSRGRLPGTPVDGYLVRYPDGYLSWSPTQAFEEGYTRITLVTDAELANLTGEHILQFFTFVHLPPHLQEISRPFCEQAALIMRLPRNPERSVALRKLLESKDAAVRACLAGPMPTVGP